MSLDVVCPSCMAFCISGMVASTTVNLVGAGGATGRVVEHAVQARATSPTAGSLRAFMAGWSSSPGRESRTVGSLDRPGSLARQCRDLEEPSPRHHTKE